MGSYQHDTAIGVLEFKSIARGIEALDSVLKEATVRVLFARPVSPGKYVCMFTGEVEEVVASLGRGARTGADHLVDRLLLPAVHGGVIKALERPLALPELDALGVIETLSVASAVRAADVAAKQAAVELLELRLAAGIGGKSYFTFTGEVADVEAALRAGGAAAAENGRLLEAVVIARPHAEMRVLLQGHDDPL